MMHLHSSEYDKTFHNTCPRCASRDLTKENEHFVASPSVTTCKCLKCGMLFKEESYKDG